MTACHSGATKFAAGVQLDECLDSRPSASVRVLLAKGIKKA